jgi:hypothetical protein
MELIPADSIEMAVGDKIYYASRTGIFADGVLVSWPMDPELWSPANMPQERFERCMRQLIESSFIRG